eukprot:2581334-Amphidinium_carterae.1
MHVAWFSVQKSTNKPLTDIHSHTHTYAHKPSAAEQLGSSGHTDLNTRSLGSFKNTCFGDDVALLVSVGTFTALTWPLVKKASPTPTQNVKSLKYQLCICSCRVTCRSCATKSLFP